ncbi:MAG: BphX family protein [Gammaproteobacteria bacterium]
MKAAKIWMVLMGIFYLLNLVALWPSLWAPQLPTMYPGVELYQGTDSFQLLLDAWLIVGIQLAAIGLVLLWAGLFSRRVERYIGVIWVAIVTEVVDGIWDIYSVMGGLEAPMIGYATVVIHLIWIGTAFWVLGKVKKELG